MSRRYALPILLIILAWLIWPLVLPARAGEITVTVRDDTVTVNGTLTVDLTLTPKAECDWYEQFFEVAERMGDLFEDTVERFLENHMKTRMGLVTINVTNFTLSLTIVKNNATYSIGATAAKLIGNETVTATASVLSQSDNNTVTVYGNLTGTSHTITVFINFTLPEWVPDDKILDAKLVLVGGLEYYGSLADTVYAYNWQTKVYDQLAANTIAPLVNGSVTIPLSLLGEQYFEDHKLVLRIDIIDQQNTTQPRLVLDEARLDILYYTFTLTLKWSMTLTGVTNTTLTGKIVNAKWRALDAEGELEFNFMRFNPARTLFFDFDEFSVPLEKWERSYNGTHTVFKLRVPNMTAVTGGGVVVTVDPVQTIIVEGYATGQGDYIIIHGLYLASPESMTYLLAGIAALVVAITLVLIITKTAKHAITGTRRTRYVRKAR